MSYRLIVSPEFDDARVEAMRGQDGKATWTVRAKATGEAPRVNVQVVDEVGAVVFAGSGYLQADGADVTVLGSGAPTTDVWGAGKTPCE